MSLPDERLRWGRTLSWAFYDFANTIYSALVISVGAALYMKGLTGLEKPAFLTMAGSLLACSAVMPFAGEVADRTGRARHYLAVLTLVACACCAGMGIATAPWLILAFLFVANICFHTSLCFYDSLLPTVAPPERMGLVSGIGVGLGYGGVALALPVGWLVLRLYGQAGAPDEMRPVFGVAAALFLLFALPLFLWVPERPASKPLRPGVGLLRLAFRRVATTVRALPRHRSVLWFLVGNFLCVDALNAGVVACVPYMKNVFGLDSGQAMLWLLPFSGTALILGVAGGKLSDVFGPRRTMISAAFCLLASVCICALTTSFAVFMVAFALLGAYGLSTTWVAGRRLLVRLVPPGQLGKYFGLYNVGHKLSMIGLVTFGVLADAHIADVQVFGRTLNAMGYRLGLAAQVVLLSAGIACIWRVRMEDASGR